MVMLFGFRWWMSTFSYLMPSILSFFNMVKALCKVLTLELLPPPVGPTTMSPWRTQIISYSSMFFLMKMGTGWRPFSSIAFFNDVIKGP